MVIEFGRKANFVLVDIFAASRLKAELPTSAAIAVFSSKLLLHGRFSAARPIEAEFRSTAHNNARIKFLKNLGSTRKRNLQNETHSTVEVRRNMHK